MTTIGEAYSVDGGQTWRWKSNDRMVPVDACQTYGIPANMVAQSAARAIETSDIIREYRASRAKVGYSAEELHEMRAAFGPGAEVVNVITGQKVKL
jgi:hypothetical protein